MFGHCYTDSNGNTSNPIVATNLAAMREKQGRLPQGVKNCVGRNDIFAQVIGEDRAGHVRTYGLGVCPTDL